MNNSFKNLIQNNLFYNYFLNKKILDVKGKLPENELLQRIIFLVKFAWRNHPGYYYDGRIENILFEYGEKLSRYIDKKRVENDIKRMFEEKNNYTILHVATKLGEVGGHTRVLYQFLKRLEDKNQILVLTEQGIRNVPQWFVNGIGANTRIITLDAINSLFERSYFLRCISKGFKKIILYHHPYDVVPIIAFSDDKCPPVLIENHAHSWFWLGPSIADFVFTHSIFHKDFTLKTRPLTNVYYLPSTQIDDIEVNFTQEDKRKAKEELKIDPNKTCIITIGTDEKFVPNSEYNFYKTVMKILKRFQNVEMFVIGVVESLYINRKYRLNTARIHFVGSVNDPRNYYKAADICLDPLPQPSLGAIWFSTVIGMSCPLLKYGTATVFNSNNIIESRLYEKYVGYLKNEKEYLDKLDFLIRNPDIRLEIAAEIREDYLRKYSGDTVVKYIREMLDLTKDIKHLPGKIGNGKYCYDEDSAEIASVSYLQDAYDIIGYFEEYLNAKDKITILLLLSTKFIYFIDIVKTGLILLKNRVRIFLSSIMQSRSVL